MTLDEKHAQLGSYWVFELLTDLNLIGTRLIKTLALGTGQITRLVGASNFAPQKIAEAANKIQNYLIENPRRVQCSS